MGKFPQVELYRKVSIEFNLRQTVAHWLSGGEVSTQATSLFGVDLTVRRSIY